MLKKIFLFCIVLVLTKLFTSCEKIIDVDLSNNKFALVIEGSLEFNSGLAEAKISRTISYLDTGKVKPISDALVYIKEQSGNSFQLKLIDEGHYKSDVRTFKTNEFYTMVVEYDGKKYQAKSFLNEPPEINDASYTFDGTNASVSITFTDKANVENYYLFRLFRSGEWVIPTSEIPNMPNLNIIKDEYIEGKSIAFPFQSAPFKSGQVATATVVSLDYSGYEYMRTFFELINKNPTSAAPSNPTSNFTNKALGNFSAYSVGQRSFLIK